MINVKALEEAAIVDNVHQVDVRNLYSKEALSISVITLEPRQSLKRHITPVDVAFYVLTGEGVVEIGEEHEHVGPGTLIESPKDIVHCWHNKSEEPLRFMVVKAPRPTHKAVLLDE